MDQRNAHLQQDRVNLLLEAAKAVKQYVDANPDPHPEIDSQSEQSNPVYQHESGQ